MGFGFDSTAAPQQQPQRDVFDVIGEADVSSRSVYPVPGVYPIVQIDALKMITNRKGDDVFVAELDILASDAPSRPVGSSMAYIVNFRHDAAAGNVRAMIAEIMNVSIDKVDGKACRFACSDDNPCHGRLVRLEAHNIITKAGKDFTICSWRGIPEEMQAQAADIRAKAGFASY